MNGTGSSEKRAEPEGGGGAENGTSRAGKRVSWSTEETTLDGLCTRPAT